jgi:hypothetical protein
MRPADPCHTVAAGGKSEREGLRRDLQHSAKRYGRTVMSKASLRRIRLRDGARQPTIAA